MNSLNSVLIEGNMVRDPMLKQTQKGTAVCNFSIASNRFYRHDSNMEQEVGFFDVEAWGRLAESCGSRGRKGRGVRVVGRLKQDRWTDQEGKNRSKVSIVAEHVEYRTEFKKGKETELDAASQAETALEEEDDGYADDITEAEEMEALAF
ncbi:MAG: single-stranded DNA-binding protein [Treponema sp.]|nr:single-stranded DNA-binding protein [Treponema sp.]